MIQLPKQGMKKLQIRFYRRKTMQGSKKSWLQKDARDQVRDVDHFEEMLESIDQELPEDIKASLEPISDLDIH
jgi:hypothetical protein